MSCELTEMSEHRGADLALDGLVHDLNNVFQTISDAAELVGSDPKWTSVAAIIERSVGQGRRIVNTIVEAGNEAIELAPIVDGAIAFTQDFVAAMKRPPVTFLCELTAGLRLQARASAMERVLVNLFINASQAATQPGCEIRLRAAEQDRRVEIVISDNGPGIPEEHLPSVFSPRFSTRPSHAGLGLHIVRTIVEEAGGTVTASSGSTGGAKFAISLPAARQDARPVRATPAC